MFDFSALSQEESVRESKFLNQPGRYAVKVVSAKKNIQSPTEGLIDVVFETREGKQFNEKFRMNQGDNSKLLMNRLAYVHRGLYGNECVESFQTVGDVLTYFEQVFSLYKGWTGAIVGGLRKGERVFLQFPFKDYFFPLDKNEKGEIVYTDQVFTENDSNWNIYVKLSRDTAPGTGTILPQSSAFIEAKNANYPSSQEEQRKLENVGVQGSMFTAPAVTQGSEEKLPF